ncbi:hypothetical protein CXP39_02200 [Mesoplasma syrphidae]|uniref:Uncharacterized protein n=1 Tax=Mesoplasma syrphidae TaxID=225999 RepID=A0A2K9BNI8_9MOLU|nr:hypothetical protein [Mesoplasma syrphidae]AUF83603.1 hypothetical protein CXP39_02200 [Mesoplasma syrphidae]
MSKEKQSNQELELGFFEPALGLIITNLEFLEDELKQENKNFDKLTKLIDKFSELEVIEEFENLVDDLVKMTAAIEKVIFEIVDVDQAKLLSFLYLASGIANNLKETELLMQIATKIEQKMSEGIFENTEENLIAEYKTMITEYAHEQYQDILTNLEIINYSDEFKKILNILTKEKDFNDLKEGNTVLVELFILENPVINELGYLKIWRLLNNLEGLLTLMIFWEQDNFEEE